MTRGANLSFLMLACALAAPRVSLASGPADGGPTDLPPAGSPQPGAPDDAEHRRKGDTPPPSVASEIGIDPPADASVPLELAFVDEAGREVKLSDYFRGDLPVLVNLVYYRCPSMCGVVLEQQLEALKKLEWSPGKEFRLLTVSINPQETPRLAAEKRRTFLSALGRPEADQGWHFLTGNEPPIQALAAALGFRYKFDLHSQEYAHAAGLFVCTPQGKLSRVLYGVEYDPRTLRLSLVEAGEGKVGTVYDRLILFCYHFDAASGRYSATAMNLMRVAGTATVLLILSYLGVMFRRERSRRAGAAAPSALTGRPS